jgi:hypothetical protein
MNKQNIFTSVEAHASAEDESHYNISTIKIKAKPINIAIVAVCREVTLFQQPNITVSLLFGYFKYRMISNFLYQPYLGCYTVNFLIT